MKRLIPSLLILLCALLSAQNAGERKTEGDKTSGDEKTPDADSGDLTGLRQAAADFVVAYNKKDAAAIAALFTEAGEMTDLDGEDITTGRDEIKAHYEEAFKEEDDKGLLVLTGDDSQMISEVSLEGDKTMKFALVGAPDGDPGLEFKKS